MKDNGLDLIDKAMVSNSGLMELNIKDHGKKIKLVEKVNLPILMEIVIKDNGKMIKLMDLEFTSIQNPKQGIKDIGKMI